ncbi:unnamed protein product [Gordionus sp. m RMFG-2023]
MKNKTSTFYITLTTLPIIGYGIYYFYMRKKKNIFLQDPNIKYIAYLKSIDEVSHDTKKFKFGLPTNSHVLGLPTGQHLYLNADIDGKKVIRPYTPISLEDSKGFFDLVIKIYHKDVHPKFPDGGKMTQHLNSLKIGDGIEVRGPSGRLRYLGDDKFSIKLTFKDKDNVGPPRIVRTKRIGMIAGGTGITPMFQMLQAILLNPTPGNKDIQFDLLFANQTEKDILLKDEIEALAKMFPTRFRYWYTVDKLTEDPKDSGKEWPYDIGYVNAKMISQHLPSPSAVSNGSTSQTTSNGVVENLETLILTCGPPPMIKFAVSPALSKLGYSDNEIFVY